MAGRRVLVQVPFLISKGTHRLHIYCHPLFTMPGPCCNVKCECAEGTCKQGCECKSCKCSTPCTKCSSSCCCSTKEDCAKNCAKPCKCCP
ncbi:metallothionein-1B-like [Panulirus ornatus]|uniref:metallothionein-1B-like n=1 Tax=Panulirus ornatus TaxID=150431 RepID=UPI003A8A16CA